MKITITDGNLPANVSVYIQAMPPGATPIKKLNIDGEYYEIPEGEEMQAAVQRREMEGEAIHLANWERRLGKLDIYSSAYQEAHAAWMRARMSFEERWGVDDTTVYNQAVLRT